MDSNAIKFGSVCSGIEAASVAWNAIGWKAAWLAEIEPFPSALLAHHYPDVPNFGDMTKLPERIRSGEASAPDVFCGGTPCQAFSVAGLRQSLDDARGNLSLVFCEIANEIDAARLVRGEQHAIIFWENVPGVLNTHDNAFGCFLAGLAGEDLPLEPPGGKWSNAGYVSGPKRTVAWRVLDAQYFGVAQRRRRVFVVASARKGFDPAAVLFEFEGVRRDSAPSREAGEAVTGATGTGASSGCTDQPVISMAHGQGGAEIGYDRGPTLTCNHEAPIAAISVHGTQDPDIRIDMAYAFQPRIGRNGRGDMGDVVNALNAQSGETGKGDAAPCVATYGIPGNRIGPRPGNGGNSTEQMHDIAPCQTKTDVHGVVAPVAFTVGNLARGAGPSPSSETFPTLTVSKGCGTSDQQPSVMTAMQVRRLTPRECERLQGFQWCCSPDYPGAWCDDAGRWWSPDYTAITVRGKPAADGPRYKSLGNSWAVPNVRWIGRRISAQLAAANDNTPCQP